MSMELNTFDPTYFNFIEIAFNMCKWEPNYHIGASPALKVTAPFYLRELVFVLEPNYICPSRARHTRNFDKAAVKVKEDLKNEIVRDITEAGHKTISITSDHGTSADKYRTKKNALTLARTTKNFVIKKDTITLINCEGSQTGAKLMSDVKKALILGDCQLDDGQRV